MKKISHTNAKNLHPLGCRFLFTEVISMETKDIQLYKFLSFFTIIIVF